MNYLSKLHTSILYLFAIFFLFNCAESDLINSPQATMPYISSRYKPQPYAVNDINVDTIIRPGSHIIINNPYKHVGKLQLKGSMHNHTTNSDGHYSPYDAAIKMRDEAKVDFYTITDHNFVTSDPIVDGMVWMGLSLEETKGVQDNGQHLCIYNLPDGFIYLYKSEDINEIIKQYSSINAIINYAHPDWWYMPQSSEKISGIKRVHFVEVLNSAVSGSERAYNILLSKFGVGVYGLGVDDFHNNNSFNLSWIVAFADKKEKTDIWKSLLRGSFYASKNGGEMEISCVNGLINVSTAEGSVITFLGKNNANHELGQVLYVAEQTDSASYKIIGNEGYIYVKVQKGTSTAISQAVVIMRRTSHI